MKIIATNQERNIGFLKPFPERESGPRLLHFNLSEKSVFSLQGLDAYTPLDASADASSVILRSESEVSGNRLKNELLVVSLVDGNPTIVFSNKDHRFVDARFDATGTKLICSTSVKDDCCFDLVSGKKTIVKTNEMGTYRSTIRRDQNAYYFPNARKKNSIMRYDFESGKISEIKIDTKEKVGFVRYLPKKSIFILSTKDDHLHAFSGDFTKHLWEIDAASLEYNPSRIWTSHLFFSEDEAVFVFDGSIESNGWGALFVINVESGDLKSVFQGQQGRGKLACHLPGYQIYLYGEKVLNLEDGSVSPFLSKEMDAFDVK